MESSAELEMTETTVDKLNKLSTKENRSFAQQARLILEIGLAEYERGEK